jgi:hypothetical protein
VKQPEDLTDEPQRPRAGIGSLIALGLGLLVLTAVFLLPIGECRNCRDRRRDLRDWLREPVIAQYRKEHPQEVRQTQDQLDELNRNCPCFHGRVTLWSELRLLIFGNYR